jgi:hypothetical protein
MFRHFQLVINAEDSYLIAYYPENDGLEVKLSNAQSILVYGERKYYVIVRSTAMATAVA